MFDGDPREALIESGSVGRRLPDRYLRSTVSNYGYNAISLVVAIVITPVLVRSLGKDSYGVWVLASSLILYLDLFQFGFAQSTIAFFARARASGDGDLMRRIATTAFVVLLTAGVVAFAIGVVLAIVVPGHLDLKPPQQSEMRVLMLLSAAAFTMSIPNDVFGSLLSGLQRYDLVFASLSAGVVIQALGSLAVLWAGGGLIALGALSAIVAVGGQLTRWWIADRLVGGLGLRRRLFDRTLIRPLGSMSFWFSLRDVALLLIERIDTVVVGLIVGVPAAAVYSIGQRLITFVGRLVRPFSAALLPFSAELAERADNEGTRETVILGSRLSLMVGLPLCLTIAMFASPLIHAWVGSGFDDAALVVVYLSVAEAMAALVETSSSMLRGRGDAKPVALGALTEAGLNLVLSVVLGRAIGIAGVALATLIARATVQVGLFLPYALARLGIRKWHFLREATLSLLLALGAAGLVALIARRWANSGELVRLGAGCGATIATYLVVLAATGLSEPERRRLGAIATRIWPSRG